MSIEIALEPPDGPTLVPCKTCNPHYPDDARAKGVEADVIVVFVVDTNGRVEVPSISLIKERPHFRNLKQPLGEFPSFDDPVHEFREAVCKFLPELRFTYRPRTPRRPALEIMPVEFTLDRGPDVPDVKPLGDAMRSMPRSELIDRLGSYPHCV